MSNLLQMLELTFTAISNVQIFCFWPHFRNTRNPWQHLTMIGLITWPCKIFNSFININRDEEWFHLVRSSTSVQSTSIIWARFRLVASPASKLNVDNILIVVNTFSWLPDAWCVLDWMTMTLITYQWAGGCCYTAKSPNPTQPHSMSNGNHLCQRRPGASNVGGFRGNHSTRPRLLKLPGRDIMLCGVDKNFKEEEMIGHLSR